MATGWRHCQLTKLSPLYGDMRLTYQQVFFDRQLQDQEHSVTEDERCLRNYQFSRRATTAARSVSLALV